MIHPAETREETVTVVDRPARTESVIVGWEPRFVCGCGAVFRERSAWEHHADSFADRAARGEISAQEAAVHSHYANGDVPVVETVPYPEETHTEIRTVTVREAWEETVVRWKCSGCGAKPDWAAWGWED
ncbi:MAG: hypothetical protein IJL66_00090 [Lachnospiraceae bacterium]|nr:hypothetical protein [Lachnospiraceae bacterium]